MASEQIQELYPKALDCGISAADFWNMSVADIFDEMESYERRRIREFKQDMGKLFVLAESTAEHIGKYLNSDNKARKPWDFFPALFQEEKKEFEQEEKTRQLEIAKENRRAYADEVKRRREAGIM